MIEFAISAPARLSLLGEHAAIYGRPSLSAAVNLRTFLKFTELPREESNDIIQLHFPDIKLHYDIPLERFLNFYRNCTFDEKNDLLHEQVLKFVSSDFYLSLSTRQRVILEAFCYLLAFVAHKKEIVVKPFHVHLSTQLMVEAGFFCQASSIVCFAACFLHWSRLQKDIHDVFDDDNLDTIAKYAARCRTSSFMFEYIDAMICAHGSMIGHQYPITNGLLTPFFNMPSVMILLVDSKVQQNVHNEINKIEEMLNEYPQIAKRLLNSIGAVTETAFQALITICNIKENTALDSNAKWANFMTQHKKLMSFIHMNRKLSELLNVSYTNLETIYKIAEKHGLCSKYTDAAGGRFAYIWCPPNITEHDIKLLSEELQMYDFDVTETKLVCSGVKIE